MISFPSLIDTARARLREASHRAVREVGCDCTDGIVYLHGKVPTFYCKQLAQEAVVRLPGVGEVVNQIEVTGDAI